MYVASGHKIYFEQSIDSDKG